MLMGGDESAILIFSQAENKLSSNKE